LVEGHRDGTMLAPWLLADVPRECRLYREEAFGPVAVVESVPDLNAAIERANDSRYGLQCGVFTSRLDHAMHAWDRLEVGGVVVGDVPSVRVDNMPYGGVKDSGVGREGVRSTIEEMTEVRLLVVRDPP
ncbi:aldehyde dehydrogenase family protein, partial [Cognatilysobacter segetis]